MNTFKANTQNNDLIGGSAGDQGDFIDAGKWLKKNRYINDGVFVLGFTMAVVENHNKTENVVVEFLVSELNGFPSVPDLLKSTKEPYKVKSIDVTMNVVEFLSLFKRLEVTLSNQGLLENKTYISE